MNTQSYHKTAGLATGLLGLLLLGWWLFHDPVKEFSELLPGADNRPEGLASDGETVSIGSIFVRLDGQASSMPGSWPRFRGANFDNICSETVKLADEWGEGGPSLLWSVDLGEGHAGPVIEDGRVFLLDYDEEKRADMLRCFSFETGQEIWSRGYDVHLKRNHGMSRTVPAVHNNHVLTIGPKCHVMCVTADSGNFVWGVDLEKDYLTEMPLWYTGQCPLIDDSVAVIAAGGTALLLGVHLENGEVLWQTPNPNGWKMSHSSVIPYTIHGRRLYVYCAIGGIVGVSAEAGTAGDIVFETTLFDRNVIAPSPVYMGDGRLFVTAGYGGGSMVLDIHPDFTVSTQMDFKPGEGLSCEQQTPILVGNYLFAILPKDAGPLRNQFICVHRDSPDQIAWSSGTTQRFGLGPYILADKKFFILSDEGVLTMIRFSNRKYEPLGEAKILDGHDAWGPLALVQGRLLARDSRRLVCVDLGKNAGRN